MLKWALVLLVVAAILGALAFSGIFVGPVQTPAILTILLLLAAGLALVARETVVKKMK